jgi:hypothetical protein
VKDIVNVLPAEEPLVADALPAPDQRLGRTRPRTRPLANVLAVLIGWPWRLAVGALLCMSYATSVVVTGWTYRFMQGAVLRGLWKRSRLRREESFDDFCASLGLQAPAVRPRWFFQENIQAALSQAGVDGRSPSALRMFGRCFRVPWFSLWQNFKIGVQALFCAYMLTGWGCLLMLFSWEFGWLNSFNKGYEQALVGPITGWIGIVLFIAAMFYVPMAQVHQAVTGDLRAFFDFRFVWRLIQARPLAYLGLAAFVALASLPFEALKTAPASFDGFIDSWTNASNAQLLWKLRSYFFWCCLFFFLTLLVARLLAARVYRGALLKVLENGWIAGKDLHPVLGNWLERLDYRFALPSETPAMRWGTGSSGWWLAGVAGVLVFALSVAALVGAGVPGWLGVLLVWAALWAIFIPVALFWRNGTSEYLRFNGRRMLFGFVFWIWFGFVAKVYVGEFLNYHPIVGFGNHAFIQFPCFSFIPSDLSKPDAPS